MADNERLHDFGDQPDHEIAPTERTGDVAEPEDDDDFPVEDVPLPMVVAWDALDAVDYAVELRALDRWVRWLSTTYVVEYATIPHCWFAHPDLREELGHLRTGWLMTRHPQAGVGAIGLDWDRHREVTLVRCKAMTAAAGCSASQGHRDRRDRAWPADQSDRLAAHARVQMALRDSAGITDAAQAIAEWMLEVAENREGLAMEALADAATDPARPTKADSGQAVEVIFRAVTESTTAAQKSASIAAEQRRDAQQAASADHDLVAARESLAAAIAKSVSGASPSTGPDLRARLQRWRDCLERLSPADAAVLEAAGRLSTADAESVSAVLARHLDAARLVQRPTDDPE